MWAERYVQPLHGLSVSNTTIQLFLIVEKTDEVVKIRLYLFPFYRFRRSRYKRKMHIVAIISS